VETSAQFYSIVPIDRMEVYYNDAVIETARATKGGIEGSIHKRVPVGRSGWFILRAITKEGHLPVEDLYAVGEMNPVYVYCGDQPSRARMPSTSCSGRVASRAKREQIEASARTASANTCSIGLARRGGFSSNALARRSRTKQP